MKVQDILNEAGGLDVKAIVDKAEAKAYDDASESQSAVSGDAILKHAHRELAKMGYDKSQHTEAKKTLAKEVARREHNG